MAQSFNVNGLQYNVISGTDVSVSKLGDNYGSACSTSGALIIPETVVYGSTTFTVKQIEEYGFNSCTNITSVTIPNSVVSLEYGAFYGCSAITTVDLGNSITTLGPTCFQNCSALQSITLPASLTTIGGSAFRFCLALSNLTIPNSVNTIGSAAFSYCTALTTMTIPNTVTNIDHGLFFGCTSLSSVNLPDNMTSLPNATFESCTSLTSVDIPNTVTSIGAYAFAYCTGLTAITIPNLVTSFGQDAFRGCTSITSLNIPSSVNSFDIWVFRDCTSLNSVTVNWLTPLSIPSNTFQGVTVSAIPLTVPAGTLAAYQSALVWQDFNPINEIVDCSLANGIEIVNSCGPFTWIDGNTYTSSNNTANVLFENGAVNGCDSLVTLNLTVSPIPTVELTLNGSTLTASMGFDGYIWTFNGNPIAGATSNTIELGANGLYAVTATNAAGCEATDSFTHQTASLEENVEFTNVSLFPNPSQGEAILEVQILKPIQTNLKVTDIQGKTLIELPITMEIGKQQIPLDLRAFESGVYFIQLSANGNVSRASFVKQ